LLPDHHSETDFEALRHCELSFLRETERSLRVQDEESEIKWISALRVLLQAHRRTAEATPSSPIHLPPILKSQSSQSGKVMAWSPESEQQGSASSASASAKRSSFTGSAPGMQHRHSTSAGPVSASSSSGPSALDKGARSQTNPLPSIEGQLQQPISGSASSQGQGQGSEKHGRHRSATQIGKEAVEAVDRFFHQKPQQVVR
jgi:hypothetical protein